MKQIQPTTIWFNGEEKIAKFISVTGVYDNNDTEAKENWRLFTDDNLLIAQGEVIINGQDYINWGNQPASNVNVWIYNYVASAINVVILP
jgi:hypothetical protein